MKHKVATNKRKHISKIDERERPVTKKVHSEHDRNCKHCGGLMKDISGDATCIMCGRSIDHFCHSCLNTGSERHTKLRQVYGKKKVRAL